MKATNVMYLCLKLIILRNVSFHHDIYSLYFFIVTDIYLKSNYFVILSHNKLKCQHFSIFFNTQFLYNTTFKLKKKRHLPWFLSNSVLNSHHLPTSAMPEIANLSLDKPSTRSLKARFCGFARATIPTRRHRKGGTTNIVLHPAKKADIQRTSHR